MPSTTVTRTGPGVYRVDTEGRSHVVYVAGRSGSLWAFSGGIAYQDDGPAAAADAPRRRLDQSSHGGASGPQTLSAPMPATVLKVLVQPGAAVKKGDTLVLLEAMKMELPLRAPADSAVIAVHCREGELVQPDVPLVDLG